MLRLLILLGISSRLCMKAQRLSKSTNYSNELLNLKALGCLMMNLLMNSMLN